MAKEDVVMTDIKMKDVSKVMREVGYNKAKNTPRDSGSTPADQLAEANENAKGVPTMADAINRSLPDAASTKGPPVVLPKEEPKGSKSKAVEKLKEKHKESEEPKGPKKVTIDMTTVKTKVTFVGKGWKPLDVKLANDAMIRAFRIKIRDEYRKGIK